MTPEQRVADALDQLCRRAHIAPADGSRDAGYAIACVWQRDGVFADKDSPCPLSAWVRKVAGLEDVPVVLFTEKGVRVLRRVRGEWRGPTVDLPAAVACAARLCIGTGAFRMPPAAEPKKKVKRKGGA